MDTLTENPRNLAFILHEAAGTRSREVVTIAAGAGILEAGTVLGEITASEKFTASPEAVTVGVEGAETATAILGYRVDATAEDVDAVVVDADAEIKASLLIFEATVDDEAKQAIKVTQLRAVGIKAR